MSGWLFALSGAAAGAAQVGLLVPRGGSPLGLLVRVGLVAAVLVLAAREGHLVPGAAGWFAGFASAAAIVHRRLR